MAFEAIFLSIRMHRVFVTHKKKPPFLRTGAFLFLFAFYDE